MPNPTFAPALERYCRSEARAKLLHNYAMRVSEGQGVEAVPARVWTEATRAEANAMKAATDLGLDPAGRARIARDIGLAQDLGRRANNRIGPQLGDKGRQMRIAEGRYKDNGSDHRAD